MTTRFCLTIASRLHVQFSLPTHKPHFVNHRFRLTAIMLIALPLVATCASNCASIEPQPFVVFFLMPEAICKLISLFSCIDIMVDQKINSLSRMYVCIRVVQDLCFLFRTRYPVSSISIRQNQCDSFWMFIVFSMSIHHAHLFKFKLVQTQFGNTPCVTKKVPPVKYLRKVIIHETTKNSLSKATNRKAGFNKKNCFSSSICLF